MSEQMHTGAFLRTSLRCIAEIGETSLFARLKELKKSQPAVHAYLYAIDDFTVQVHQDMAQVALGAWQAAKEACPHLRRISTEHLNALELRSSNDLDILERIDDPIFLMQKYDWLCSLARLLPSARNAAKIEEQQRFLLRAKTILDTFGQAARLSPRFSPACVHEYEIRISLQEIVPEIFRVFRVSGRVTLKQLHKVIQTVMGWTDSHQHLFELDGIEFGIYDPEDDEVNFVNETEFRLQELAQGSRIKLKYIYDFGDHWVHLLDIVPLDLLDDNRGRSVCIEGQRSCPPEDCGGSYQYSRMLKVLSHPRHKRFTESWEWVGLQFEPERFDLNETNRRLNRTR